MLSCHLAPHEADRGDREGQREGERDAYTAVCDRLCLHEAVCDACIMFECASLFMCTVYVPEWVCVFQKVQRSPAEGAESARGLSGP